MASKRFAKTAVNWVELAEKIPENQKSMFQSLKSKSDNYLRKMNALPEKAPEINWSMYQKAISNQKLVDDFRKSYESLKIPYPKNSVEQQLNEMDKEAAEKIREFVAESNRKIAVFAEQYERFKNMPAVTSMCREEFIDRLPEYAIDPVNRPTFYPHDDPTIQVGYEGEDKETRTEV